jgi:hypothetical protein
VDAHIGYMAIVSDQPEVLAEFYATHFGMWKLGSSAEGDVSITDSFLNVSILKRRPGVEGASGRPGLSHYGICIQDIREVERKLEEFAPHTNIEEEKGDLHRGEYRVYGPNGLPISLSTKNFGVTGTPRMLPRIRHMAFNFPKVQDDQMEFLANVFGFRELKLSLARREQGRTSRFGGDGYVNIALLALSSEFSQGRQDWDMRDQQEAERLSKTGFNHFGFVVEDKDAIMAGLPSQLQDTTKASMATVDMAEYRIHDPDHNGIDLSTRGYEVGYDQWVNSSGKTITSAERFATVGA